MRYKIILCYLKLPSIKIAIERVKFRVSQGGHNISEQVIVRRFERSWINFIQHYKPLSDSWIVCDASGKYPAIIDKSYV